MKARNMLMQSKHISLLPLLATILIGAILSFVIIRIGQFEIKWMIGMFIFLCFLLIWPIHWKLTGNSEHLLWIVLVLSIPLGFDIHLIHRDYVGTIRGIVLNLTDIALFALIVLWFYRLANNKENRIKFNPQTTIPFFLYFVFHMTSLINSPDMELTFYSIIHIGKILIFYLFIINRVRDEKILKMIVQLLVISLIIESSFCIVQFVTKTNFTTSFGVVQDKGDTTFRIAGTTGSPNVAASLLASLIPIPLLFLLTKEDVCPRILLILSATLGFIALILSQTRGAWLSFVLGMVLFFLFSGRQTKTMWKIVIASVLIIGLFFIFFHNVILERFAKGTETLTYRWHLVRGAFAMVQSYPLFGIGANIYALVMSDYMPFFLRQEQWIVHNRYLLIWSELGTVGLLSFLILIVMVMRNMRQCMKSSDKFINTLSWGLFLSFFVFCFQMMFESLDGRVPDTHFWVIASVSVGLKNWIADQEDNRIISN